MTDFKVGDKVRISKEHEKVDERFRGQTLEVSHLDPPEHMTRLITVTRADGARAQFFNYRLEKVTLRTEGETILREDIRIGDEIRTDIISGDLTFSRQGTVSAIKRDFNESIWTAKNRRLDFNNPEKETITLIKAAPEVDKVLDRAVDAEIGAVVEFKGPMGGRVLSRKSKADSWEIFYANGMKFNSNEEFAEIIREQFDTVRWLS